MERQNVGTSMQTFEQKNTAWKWQKKHVMCVTCEQWLLAKVYSDEKGFSYCEGCKPSTGVAIRSYALEDMFLSAGLKYPCQLEKCAYIGGATDLQVHLREDPHGRLACPICKTVTTDTRLMEHFSIVHSEFVHSITVADLCVDIPYETLPKQQCVFNVTLVRATVQHTFLVLIAVDKRNIYFKVASPAVELLGKPEFAVQGTALNRTVTHRGTIHKVWPVFTAAQEVAVVEMSRTSGLTIRLYFGGALDVTEMQQCEICDHDLHWKVYQCVGGHCVCSSCRTKISNCPVCRGVMLAHETSLEHLFPNNTYPCPHVQNGCIFIGIWCDIRSHLNSCRYKIKPGNATRSLPWRESIPVNTNNENLFSFSIQNST